ncbi:MAG: hypothetical protein JXB85_13545 [Anaerolineales bacterium]|nr:hypothetical protein [Anaerolineales bacterium]
MPTNTIAELFELSIALERAAESFYRGLGQLFAHEPEVVNFWQKYEREEAGHARFLEQLVTRVNEEKLRQAAPADLLTAARRLLQISPEELLANITNLEEAYQIALQTENAETNLIFEALIADFAVTSQAVTFLKRQLKDHAEGISRDFPPRFDTPAARIAVQADR